MYRKTKIAAVVGTTLLALVAAPPALAARPPAIDLRGATVGSYTLDANGTAHLTGAVVGTPFGGSYRAALYASDGSLPAPGECEPATASVHVTGSKGRTLDLAASGEVCGEFPDATYVVTHDFVGRYLVTDSSARKLQGTDGWISLILATEGRANIEVFDS